MAVLLDPHRVNGNRSNVIDRINRQILSLYQSSYKKDSFKSSGQEKSEESKKHQEKYSLSSK